MMTENLLPEQSTLFKCLITHSSNIKCIIMFYLIFKSSLALYTHKGRLLFKKISQLHSFTHIFVVSSK